MYLNFIGDVVLATLRITLIPNNCLDERGNLNVLATLRITLIPNIPYGPEYFLTVLATLRITLIPNLNKWFIQRFVFFYN